MKTLFSILLIFLLISCCGGSKTPLDDDVAAVLPDGDEDVMDDEEFVDDEDDDDEPDTKPDKDSDKPENNEDVGLESNPCEGEPCKGVENSTGKCLASGKGYTCECKSSYVWFSSEQKCLPVTNFYGTVCTGQTKCYDMEKEIQCPKEGETFYGQDAQYAKLGTCMSRNFTVQNYGEGKADVVFDSASGLEWQRKVAPWHPVNFMAAHYCNVANFGGHCDWRLPTVDELVSIVDIEKYDPAIDENYFPDTPSTLFYSNEYGHYTQSPYSFYGYGVDFEMGNETKYDSNYVDSGAFRCVRNEFETVDIYADCNSKYLFSDIVASVFADLVFQKSPVADKAWLEALEYCENLNFAGISEWRLPNKNEIKLLQGFASNDAWTSTSSNLNPIYAWVFPGNETQTKTKPGKAYCVAANPCEKGKEIWNGQKCTAFSDLNLNKDGCNCMDGYVRDGLQCVKAECEDDCKTMEHSTGVCIGYSKNITHCQCEKGYFYNYDHKCVNPCDEEPCKNVKASDGSCTATDYNTFECGCIEGYYYTKSSCYAHNSCYDAFYSQCRDARNKLMWSFPPSTYGVEEGFEAAKQYCAELCEGGYTDWRFPTIDDFRTMSKCANTGINGKCKVSEKSGCLSESCMTDCACSENETSTGEFFYWSSSLVSDMQDSAFVLDGMDSSIKIKNIKTDIGSFRCIRNLE